MNNVIIIRYSEIFLKGKNFGFFEKKLFDNIHEKISNFECDLIKSNKRFFIENYDIKNEKKLIEILGTIFGINSISPAIKIESNIELISNYISTLNIKSKTFRVTVNRADKNFPISSIEFSKNLGAIILDNNKNISVDLHSPDTIVYVDIRETKFSYIYTKVINGLGGMPVGTSGSGLLLLSGGIDSPVAGYMMARRGMEINAIHFHSYPYTSESAKQKVIKLANIIKKFTGSFKLYIVSFTKIQENIHKNCSSSFMITLMRRIMFRIAEKIAKANNFQCIITGENLGQVASQTVESMTVTNAVIEDLPVFRPLISFDKDDISKIATNIGTFETSILPYEDCCTVFLPKHPVIKPSIDKCLKEEQKLDIMNLIDDTLKDIEIIDI